MNNLKFYYGTSGINNYCYSIWDGKGFKIFKQGFNTIKDAIEQGIIHFKQLNYARRINNI